MPLLPNEKLKDSLQPFENDEAMRKKPSSFLVRPRVSRTDFGTLHFREDGFAGGCFLASRGPAIIDGPITTMTHYLKLDSALSTIAVTISRSIALLL